MSIARHHSEWLSLIEVSGPFLSIPVLMRFFPQGLIAHDPEKTRTLRLAHEEWEANAEAGHRTNPAIHGAWIKYILTSVLGLPEELILEQQAIPQSIQTTVPEHAELLRPSLVVVEPGTSKPRILVQTYPLDQDLDKPVSGKRWKASPSTRMMELLHNTGVRLGLVTNGERWMLVDAPKSETTGFASWYANLWLEEPITLRAFISLLSADRFFNSPAKETLETMLAESASNQQEVTEQLGYQVRRAVEVLVQSLDRADQDHDRHLLEGVEPKLLYEASLTIMMRLVFLFCSEERRLLPIDSELYATHYAASTMREQLRKTADDHGEEILERRHDAWCRLLACFRLVFGGCEHANLRMPAYGGHLFDPDRFPFLEGRKPNTSWRNCVAEPLPVNNRTVLHLLEALQMLEVKMPGGEKAARRLSFRALDIEQIGHVYEGLLDHTAKRATEPMIGLVGGRNKEPEIPLSKLEELLLKKDEKLVEFLSEETGKSANALKKLLKENLDLTSANRFQAVVGNDAKLLSRIAPFAGLIREDTFGYPVVISTSSVFVTAGTDRRSSGTHYTPRSLTEPIVQYTLEPLVYVGPAEGKPKEEWQLRTPKELLDLKICDMACGSGAFLVQACRYLSERLVEAWEQAEKTHPGTPGITPEGEASKGATGEALIPKDADERMAYAKRLVAQRCLYGVDINPLAAEMAKLSLWLLTLAKDKPFTFLDHTIRCGDSLLGIHDLDQLRNFNFDPREKRSWQFGELPLDELITATLTLRVTLETMPCNTADDTSLQESLLQQCHSRTEALYAAADLLLVAELRSSDATRDDAIDSAAIRFGHDFSASTSSLLAANAAKTLGRRRFHWPLEFPEVVVGRGGFDAFLGNPPFKGGAALATLFGDDWRALVVRDLGRDVKTRRGQYDFCVFFFLQACRLLKQKGGAGMIATNSFAQGDSRMLGLSQMYASGRVVYRAVNDLPWPGTAATHVSLVWLFNGDWDGQATLDGRPVRAISDSLSEHAEGNAGDPLRLQKNKGIAFRGAMPYGEGFFISQVEAESLLLKSPANAKCLRRYLIGDDLNSRPDCSASRFIIDFRNWPLLHGIASSKDSASDFPELLAIVEERVKPQRLALRPNNSTALHRRKYWWQFSNRANDLLDALEGKSRALGISRTTAHLAFAFVDTHIVLSERLVVVADDTFATFSLLQSTIHEAWAFRPGTMTQGTTRTYFVAEALETFPRALPVPALTSIGERYYDHRSRLMMTHEVGLTNTYNRFHNPEENTPEVTDLRLLHQEMDEAVSTAYGWNRLDLGHGFHETKQGTRFTISEKARREVLARLLKLNHERYTQEVAQGLHDKKKASKPRATKTAVAMPEMADIGLFASLAYPATDADRAICAAALAVIESRPGLSSMEHLDALLLATHPEWCAAFLDDAGAKAVKRAVKAAPKALVVGDNTPINWKQSRDYLEQRGAIRVLRGDIEQSLQLAVDSKAVVAVKASFPSGIEGIVGLALKAVERLTMLKEDSAEATEDQKRFVIAIQREEQAVLRVA